MNPMTYRNPLLGRWNTCWLLLFLSLALVGCGQDQSRPRQLAASPEADLDWAMQRLQRALDLSKPSGETGLLSKRAMRYRYQGPTATQPDPTAVVTIDTITVFRHDKFSPPDTSAAAAEQPSPLTLAEELADPASLEQQAYLQRQQELQGGRPTRSAVVDTPVPVRRKEESKKFHLVFQDGAWKLTDVPEVSYERLWFEYALK